MCLDLPPVGLQPNRSLRLYGSHPPSPASTTRPEGLNEPPLTYEDPRENQGGRVTQMLLVRGSLSLRTDPDRVQLCPIPVLPEQSEG